MADRYIDPTECVIYGRLACEEMRRLVLPLHRGWSSSVERCIELQEQANGVVGDLVARAQVPQADPAKVAEAADAIQRFGSWLGSLKGRPLDPATFFQGGAPSAVARRRLPKMVGALDHMITALTPIAEGGPRGRETVPGAAAWLEELRAAREVAVQERDAQRAGKTEQAQLSPELEKARLDWQSTYVANKRIVEGILRHHGKENLMPLVFDDLAEVQRSKAAPMPVPDPQPPVS